MGAPPLGKKCPYEAGLWANLWNISLIHGLKIVWEGPAQSGKGLPGPVLLDGIREQTELSKLGGASQQVGFLQGFGSRPWLQVPSLSF